MARPSFINHQIASVLGVIASIIGFYWLITQYRNINNYEIFIFFILLSISWGISSHLHFMEEVHYDYNPLTGDFEIKDDPVMRDVITYRNYRYV